MPDCGAVPLSNSTLVCCAWSKPGATSPAPVSRLPPSLATPPVTASSVGSVSDTPARVKGVLPCSALSTSRRLSASTVTAMASPCSMRVLSAPSTPAAVSPWAAVTL